ncbi:uncharacterized protein A1O9_04793, partial [Exophiala aquamarina CBS 119918]
MSFLTQTTVTETTIIAAFPTIVSDVTATVTSYLATTLFATQGQTVTIASPDVQPPASATTKYTPTTTTRTSTATLTEIDVYLQNAQGEIYSTWIIPLSLAPPTTDAITATISETPRSSVYIVQSGSGPGEDDVWDNWSKGARAGLIVGVVLAAALIFAMVWWCCRRSNIWLAHGWWPWMGQGAAGQVPPTPCPNIVQPTYVNGPLTPYTYGQPSVPAYGAR